MQGIVIWQVANSFVFSVTLIHLNSFILIVIVTCVPREHLKVHENSLKSVRAFQIELEFGSVGF